jgi:antitoxin (DNA-binding transcriptional repressor) of toxin-antitoxin stability system
MSKIISAKRLRQELAEVVERVRKGERFTVLYRSRAAFQILPVDADPLHTGSLEEESLYQADAVGDSADGLTSVDHDRVLYGKAARRRRR